MLKRRAICIAILLFSLFGLGAEASFSIRFFDKRVYVVGQPIPLKLTLKNDGTETFRCKLADDKMYSVSFDLRTASNRPIEPSNSFIRKQARNQPVFYREVSIEPGEEYSFVEDLAPYVKLTESGVYTLSCSFFPELAETAPPASPGATVAPVSATEAAAAPLVSNRLMITLRPEAGVSPVEQRVDQETKEVLQRESVSPDEVVRRTIVARQQGKWNAFFLYMDLETMLLRDSTKKSIYQRESDEGRMRMIERYRAELMKQTVDNAIVTIPTSFEIIDTKYTPHQGQVRVMERFKFGTYTERREYTYYLKTSDDIWYIYDYSVSNKGTE